MPLVGSSAFVEYRLKSSANVPAAPVATVSTPAGPDEPPAPELPPPQAASPPLSRPPARSAAVMVVVRTRQGLADITETPLSLAAVAMAGKGEHLPRNGAVPHLAKARRTYARHGHRQRPVLRQLDAHYTG